MNKINKIEAIVDALASVNEAHKADSLAYRLRNPLLLRSYSRPGRHEVTEEGVRVFDSHLGGYKAAIFDVALKINGESHVGIQPTDKLRNLIGVLGIKNENDILSIVYFLRKALSNKDIDQFTVLSYFLE